MQSSHGQCYPVRGERLGMAREDFINGRYKDRYGRVWTVTRLAAHAEGLPVFDLPLKHIDLSEMPICIDDISELSEHVKRVVESGDEPIIMSDRGEIMDGWHRITRALVEGRETVKAVRFTETPYREFVEE